MDHGTVAPYFLAKALETAQIVALTSSAGQHTTHHELVVDSSYVGTPQWQYVEGMRPVYATYIEPDNRVVLGNFERLLSLAATKSNDFIALTDDQIRMFDRALMASSELLYELKV